MGHYYSFQLSTLLSSLFGDTDNQIIKAYEKFEEKRKEQNWI